MKYLLTISSLLLLCSCAEGLQGSTSDGGHSSTTTITASTSASETVGNSNTTAQQGVEKVCVPGSTQLCNGPGACFGAQTCRVDGSGYETCICSEGAAQTTGPSTSTTTTTTTAGPTTTGGGDPTCDPMSPTAVCGPGRQCIPQSNGDPICSQAGNGNFFDLCVDFSQCLPGLDCVNDGMNSCCMAWCRLGYNDCPTSFTCVEVLGNPTVDGVTYGVCWDGYPCVL